MRVKMSKRPWTEREIGEFRRGMADYLRETYADALRQLGGPGTGGGVVLVSPRAAAWPVPLGRTPTMFIGVSQRPRDHVARVGASLGPR